MAKADKTQQAFDKSVESDIEESIKSTLRGGPDDEQEEPENPEEEESVKKRKKDVEKDEEDTDTESDDDPDKEKSGYQKVVDKIIAQEFDGDESKLEEAKRIANVAVKTFNGDPIRAAKSYRNLWRKHSEIDDIVKKNPFIEKLIKEAREKGEVVDENYVKNLVGAVTSTEQPTDKTKQTKDSDPDQLIDDDDFDLDSLSADQLIEAGVLDKTQYQNAASVDKKDMVEKAKIRYGYKVLPEKMAEKSVKLQKQKEQELSKQETIDKAKKTNKQRLIDNHREVVSKYDVDFENNPEHAQLWEQIQQKAYRIPDLDDENGMLIKPTAFEEAMQYVFNKNDVPLRKVSVPSEDEDDEPTDTTKKTKHKQPMKSGDEEAIARILSDANAFKGKSTSKSSQEEDEEDPNDLNAAVNKKVSDNIQRGFRTSTMISSERKMDKSKS